MEPIKPPKVIKIYSLVKQSGLNFSPIGTISGPDYIGTGYFTTLQEAEHHRTLEVLKVSDGNKLQFHIYELEVPNPAYEGTE